MKSKPQQPTKLDLSYVRAASFLPPSRESLRLVMVGCGGTGSWLAPSVARIARLMIQQRRDVQVAFIDPDKVEPKNIPRQNFCDAEVGSNKAAALAARLSAAWGLDICAVPQPFEVSTALDSEDEMTLLIGCVDNAKAREQLAAFVARNSGRAAWLDCGNEESSGQVIFGTAMNPRDLEGAFTPSCKFCSALPAPAIVAPDLLQPRPEELAASKLSCAEIALANTQSLAVNQMVASVATDYLLRITHGGLRRFATYFDLGAGSMRSRYISVEEVATCVQANKLPNEWRGLLQGFLVQKQKSKKAA
jgi:PRTRC genetic system ThiF family protein